MGDLGQDGILRGGWLPPLFCAKCSVWPIDKRQVNNLSSWPCGATKGAENRPFAAALSRWQAGGPPHTGLAVDRPEARPTTDFNPPPVFSMVPHHDALLP